MPAPAGAVRAGALWVEQAAGMGAKGGGWMSRFGRHEAGRPRRTGMDGVGKGRELMWGGSEGGSKTVLRRAWAETFRVYTANVGGLHTSGRSEGAAAGGGIGGALSRSYAAGSKWDRVMELSKQTNKDGTLSTSTSGQWGWWGG